MADEKKTNDQQAQAPAKKSGMVKNIFLIGGMLAFEAVLIIGAMMFVGGPNTVQATETIPGIEPEDEKIVEALVLDDRLPNNRQGINYVYDTEIWVHVTKKHETRVTDEINRFRNEIRAELMAIWRTAEPRHLQEPRMETLTRKVQAMLDRRFGSDSESESPIIEKCVIVSGPPFRVDG